MLACLCDSRGRLGREQDPYPQRDRLLRALRVAQAVPSDRVAQQAQAEGLSGPQIAQAIRDARTQALKAMESGGAAA
jgi:tRNA nucleotidyltransferase (CCA-adding enzyme)